MNTIFDFLGIKLLPETAKKDPDNADIYQIEAVDLHLVPKVCPVCKQPIVSKGSYHKIIYDYCSLPYGDKEKHIYKIKLKNRRFECKNKSSTHSFTVGITNLKSPYTNAFKHHVVSSYLKQPGVSYTDVATNCSLSVPTVSMIVNGFAEQIRTWYLPDQNMEYLQLTRFHYQENNRYYLAQTQHEGKPSLLAFFGYQDAEKELEEYWESYRKNYIYASKNTTYIATNLCQDYHEVIQSTLPDSIISYDDKTLYSHFESFGVNYPDGCYSEIYKKISDITDIFLKRGDDSQISDWCEDMSPDAAEHFNELRFELRYHLPLLKLSAEKFTTDFWVIDDDISYYNKHNLPFNIMVLRMMYRNRGDSIFDNENMSFHFIPKPVLRDNDGILNIFEAPDDEILREFGITDEISFDDLSSTEI